MSARCPQTRTPRPCLLAAARYCFSPDLGFGELPPVPGTCRDYTSLTRESLLTGWSLVRIRPGEPSNFKDLRQLKKSEKASNNRYLATTLATIYKFRRILWQAGHAGLYILGRSFPPPLEAKDTNASAHKPDRARPE